MSSLFEVFKKSFQVSGCFFLIKPSTLSVSSASKIALCAPPDSKPFILAKDSNFITALPFALISVFNILLSTAKAPLAIFSPSCLLLGEALVMYGYLIPLKNFK